MAKTLRVGRRYRDHPPTGDIDTLVIGSGMGGLTTAVLLARHAGQRVVVLERHWMPGGFTHVYRRHGYEWDVGVHYIGGVGNPRASTYKLFDHVTGGALRWAPMGDVYDRVALGDRVYDFVAGAEPFRARMEEYFPREARAIGRYLDLTARAKRWSRLYFAEKALPAPLPFLLGPAMRAPFLRHARRTTGEVLDELTGDAELKAVLTGQFGDYGLAPGRSSFAMHAMLARHYLQGGYYPAGGASELAASMAPQIEAAGGEILYQAEVRQILVRGDRAVGVQMADGAEIRARRVVSDAGVHNTLLRLLPREVVDRRRLLSGLAREPHSAAHLCLYVGLRKTAAELGLPKSNLWIYPGPDHDANVEGFLADPDRAPLPVVYASFPSAKDPTFESRYPGRATVQLITLAPFERFQPWAEAPWRRRGQDYEALKAAFAERMLEPLDRWVPGLRNEIDTMEVSTPLSTRHFAAYEHGEIYGLEHTPRRFLLRGPRPRTGIRGLFLTGQDVVSCGVAGAMAAGYLTASVMLRRNLLAAASRR